MPMPLPEHIRVRDEQNLIALHLLSLRMRWLRRRRLREEYQPELLPACRCLTACFLSAPQTLQIQLALARVLL